MNKGKILLGVLAGAAVGALLGVLLAPDKGSVTRKKISKKGTDYADALKEKYDELIEAVTERLVSVKDEAQAAAANGKMNLEDARKDLKKL